MMIKQTARIQRSVLKLTNKLASGFESHRSICSSKFTPVYISNIPI